MTTPINSPHLAQDLLRIHRALKRGLSVACSRGAEYLQEGFPDADVRKGFADYIYGLTIVLRAHHLVEDEVAFPAIKEKIPFAPYKLFYKNHQEIESLLSTVKQPIQKMVESGNEAGFPLIIDNLQKVYAIWRPHIQSEEHHFSSDALAASMSPEEQNQLSDAMGKHNQEHAVPGYLAIPFVLFNLEAYDRAAMAVTLPNLIMEELVPIAWKDQWAPMKPFLLE